MSDQYRETVRLPSLRSSRITFYTRGSFNGAASRAPTGDSSRACAQVVPSRGVLGELCKGPRRNRRQKTRCRYHLPARCRLLRQHPDQRSGMRCLAAGKTESLAEPRRRRASCACLIKQLCTLFLSERQRRWPGRYQKPEERTHEDSKQVDRRQRSTTHLMGLKVRVIHG